MNKKVKYINTAYEICIAILVLVAVTLAFLDLIGKISIVESPELLFIENSILAIFSIDYFSRLYFSDNKKIYVRKHVFDLIAIIPFNSLFRAFRFVGIIRFFQTTEAFKILKLIRLFAFINKLKWKLGIFLQTNGFVYIILLTFATILLGAVGFFCAENNHTVKNLGDALWWSIVTAIAVGYGDIVPETTAGRIIASIVMIIGTTLIGIYIGTITTYFIHKKKGQELKKRKEEKIDVSYLKKSEIEEVQKYIDYILHKR